MISFGTKYIFVFPHAIYWGYLYANEYYKPKVNLAPYYSILNPVRLQISILNIICVMKRLQMQYTHNTIPSYPTFC